MKKEIMTKRQFERTRELFYKESEGLILFFRFVAILTACSCCFEQTWMSLFLMSPFIVFMATPIPEYLRNWLWSETAKDITVLPKATVLPKVADVKLLEESR